MTTFEELLLKNGNPDLLLAFAKEYEGIASSEFMENFAIYCKKTSHKLNEFVTPAHFNPFTMTIKDFLARYGTDLSSSLRTRIDDYLRGQDIRTIEDLMEWRKEDIIRIYHLGRKSVNGLERTLKKIGLELKH